MGHLDQHKALSGILEPIPTLEVQTLPEDTDHSLDAMMKIHPLRFGRYQRKHLRRAAYDPNSDNPHRWWNNGKGLPDRLD